METYVNIILLYFKLILQWFTVFLLREYGILKFDCWTLTVTQHFTLTPAHTGKTSSGTAIQKTQSNLHVLHQTPTTWIVCLYTWGWHLLFLLYTYNLQHLCACFSEPVCEQLQRLPARTRRRSKPCAEMHHQPCHMFETVCKHHLCYFGVAFKKKKKKKQLVEWKKAAEITWKTRGVAEACSPPATHAHQCYVCEESDKKHCIIIPPYFKGNPFRAFSHSVVCFLSECTIDNPRLHIFSSFWNSCHWEEINCASPSVCRLDVCLVWEFPASVRESVYQLHFATLAWHSVLAKHIEDEKQRCLRSNWFFYSVLTRWRIQQVVRHMHDLNILTNTRHVGSTTSQLYPWPLFLFFKSYVIAGF